MRRPDVTFLELFETLRIELNLDKRRDVKLSIALVYPKRDGKFSVTPITELSVYAPNMRSSRICLALAPRLTRIKSAFLCAFVTLSSARKSAEAHKQLQQKGFEPGDFVDVAILA